MKPQQRSGTSRQTGADRDDLRRLVTYRHSHEATMHANESNTNKQAKNKGVWIILVLKKALTNITKPPNTQAANTNKQANEVCEYFSF